jgi:hypothetical protein
VGPNLRQRWIIAEPFGLVLGFCLADISPDPGREQVGEDKPNGHYPEAPDPSQPLSAGDIENSSNEDAVAYSIHSGAPRNETVTLGRVVN